MASSFGNFFESRSAITATVLALLAILVAAQTARSARDAQSDVDITSLTLAQHLHQSASPSSETATNTSGARAEPFAAAPGYPLLLAGLAKVDRAIADGLACDHRQETCDRSQFTTLFVIQGALAVLSLVVIFFTAWTLSASWYVAMLTLVFAYIAGSYGTISGSILPLIWPQMLMLSFLLFMAMGTVRNDLRWTGVAGVALGGTALFLPSMLLVGGIVAITMWMLGRNPHQGLKRSAAHPVALIAGILLVVGLVAASPGAQLLKESTLHHMLEHLSQRVAYNAMDLRTWFASLLAPLPFVGGLADNLFGAEVVRNLATDHAHDPLPQNARDIYHAALASAPDALSQICWLFKTHVLGDFASYSATLPSVLMHGLWAGTPILSLLGLLHLKPLLAYSRNDQRPLPILLVFVAVISLLVFNTLLTGNQRGNNLGLVFLYTYATAYLVARMDVRRQLDAQHVASA